jgi:hypothetical protein
MKRFFTIFLFILIGCAERELILPQNPCPDIQSAIDNYRSGNLLIKSGCEVLISKDLYIRGGKMEIEEGATLYFKDCGLIIEKDAELIVYGRSDKPVFFTSQYLEPLKGDWKGIIINGSASIEGGIVEFADDGISLIGVLNMIDSEIRRNLFYGIRMDDINALFEINRSKFYENLSGDMLLFSDALTLLSPGLDFEGFIVVDGSDGIINSGDWQPYEYLFTGDVEIRNGAHISVKPGAKIYVETGYAIPPYEIKVKDRASLSIKGASFEASDIDYCWGGIVFYPEANPSTILDSKIYDGGDGYYEANISVFSDLTIEKSEIGSSCSDGIYIGDGGFLSMSDSSVTDNAKYGVYVDCGGTFEDFHNYYEGNLGGDIAEPTVCP